GGNLVPVARQNAKLIPTISSGLSNGLAGGNFLAQTVLTELAGVPAPLVPLNADPCDDFVSLGDGTCADGLDGRPLVQSRTPHSFFQAGGLTLNQVLTDEQEALLGCGMFWGTDCEADGIDLLNAEASVLQQSWVGFEGN